MVSRLTKMATESVNKKQELLLKFVNSQNFEKTIIKKEFTKIITVLKVSLFDTFI